MWRPSCGAPAELGGGDLHPRELGDHQRSVDEGVALRASSRRGRRDRAAAPVRTTAGPSTTITVGTTPEQSTSALATRPQPSRPAMPSSRPGPGRRQHDDERHPIDAGDRGGVLEVGTRRAHDSGVPLAPARGSLGELDPDDGRSPSGAVERAHLDGRRVVDRAAQRQAAWRSSLTERSAGHRAERSSGKASEPSRTPTCSSARAGSHGADDFEQRLGRAARSRPPVRRQGNHRGGSSGTCTVVSSRRRAGARRSPARSPRRGRRRLGWRAGARRRPPPRPRAGHRASPPSSTRRSADPGGGSSRR